MASMASKIEPRKSEKGDEDWFFSSSVTWAVVVVNWEKGVVVVGGGGGCDFEGFEGIDLGFKWDPTFAFVFILCVFSSRSIQFGIQTGWEGFVCHALWSYLASRVGQRK
ncbi:hypothetical protein ACFX11_038370 [Malus domestica]